jgi:hypothetical protein
VSVGVLELTPRAAASSAACSIDSDPKLAGESFPGNVQSRSVNSWEFDGDSLFPKISTSRGMGAGGDELLAVGEQLDGSSIAEP